MKKLLAATALVALIVSSLQSQSEPRIYTCPKVPPRDAALPGARVGARTRVAAPWPGGAGDDTLPEERPTRGRQSRGEERI